MLITVQISKEITALAGGESFHWIVFNITTSVIAVSISPTADVDFIERNTKGEFNHNRKTYKRKILALFENLTTRSVIIFNS